MADPQVPQQPFETEIQESATKYGVDPNLVRAVIRQESNFNPQAVSPKGAQGLMQIMPATGQQLGLVTPFEPKSNIDAGTRHLKYLLDKYPGNIPHALAAYNAGEGNVQKHGGVPPFPETQDYVLRIMKSLEPGAEKPAAAGGGVVGPVTGNTRADLLQRIKALSPAYAALTDDDLSAKVIAKYPQYEKYLTQVNPPTPGEIRERKPGVLGPTVTRMGEQLADSPLGRLVRGVPKAPMGMAVPGGPLVQIPGQAAVAGAEALFEGKTPAEAAMAAGKGAAGAALVGGAVKGGEKVLSGLKLPKFVAQIQDDLTNALKSNVPAWKDMKSLKEMFFSQRGMNALHADYDKALKAVVEKGTGVQVQLPAKAAERLGVESQGVVGSRTNPLDMGTVLVDAGELATKMTGAWKQGEGAYRAAANALDKAGIGDPAARAAYKTGIGMRDYLIKQGALDPSGKIDIFAAQKGLTGKNADVLLRRQLGPLADLLTPGGKIVEKGSLAVPGGAAGGILGGTLGGSFVPGLGHISGALPGAYYGARLGGKVPTYTGMPQGDVANFLQRFGPAAGGMAGSKVGSTQ